MIGPKNYDSYYYEEEPPSPKKTSKNEDKGVKRLRADEENKNPANHVAEVASKALRRGKSSEESAYIVLSQGLPDTITRSKIRKAVTALGMPTAKLDTLVRELESQLMSAHTLKQKLAILKAGSLVPLAEILRGNITELSLEEIGQLPAVLALVDLPGINLHEIAQSIIDGVCGVDYDPAVATQAHKIIHEFAAHLLMQNDFEGAFQLECLALTFFPLPDVHPLHNMDAAIERGAARQYDVNRGANFSEFDSSVLKCGHLHATTREIDGELLTCFDFKISHVARDELSKYLEAITHYRDEFVANLPEGLCTGVSIDTDVPQEYVSYNEDDDTFTRDEAYCPGSAQATEITFHGAGKVIIGTSQDKGTMYNWIQVEMPASLAPGEGAKRLQQMLGMVGLGPILGKQPEESTERMKIAQILRAFYPSLATELDTQKDFYTLPIDLLKARIIQQEPGMRPLFTKYLETNPELMTKIEILPGKEVWGIADLGDQMREHGAWGLMTGVGNSAGWDSAKRAIARIFTEGALSSEERFKTGMIKKGCSAKLDIIAGGADQVFTRMINEHVSDVDIDDFPLHGHAQILWNLDSLVQRVPYGYEEDKCGVRNRFDSDYHNYQERRDLLELAQEVTNPYNEMMFKGAIDPSHIVGVVVSSEDEKLDLLEYLLDEDIAKLDESGAFVIIIQGREILADDLIHVGNKFQKEWWPKPEA